MYIEYQIYTKVTRKRSIPKCVNAYYPVVFILPIKKPLKKLLSKSFMSNFWNAALKGVEILHQITAISEALMVLIYTLIHFYIKP